MLAALNRKTVLRGAIEMGMAAELEEADIYGPVLADVHRLESRDAGYPRILVGPRLQAYLHGLASNTERTGPARINRGAANGCMKLLGVDTDGKCIVDYLNDWFSGYPRKSDLWEKYRVEAYHFVLREMSRFEQEGNTKLTKRYREMAAYYESRGVGK